MKCWHHCTHAVLAYGPLARYVKLRVAHAPRMPGTFSPPSRVSDPDMHHGTCITHVPWCMPGSLTTCFLWSRWQGKRSRHSRRMHNPQFYVSGKRPMMLYSWGIIILMTASKRKYLKLIAKMITKAELFFKVAFDSNIWWAMRYLLSVFWRINITLYKEVHMK